jgi:alpha-L-arabinofuranosidase
MKKLSIISTLIVFVVCIHAQTKPIVVKVNEVKADVSPTMWGVFFEDINLGADGGLYAELVKNRSFEFFKPLMGWTVKQKQEGDVLVLNRKEENNNNPRYIRVTTRNASKDELNLVNEGFRGMGIKNGLRYDFSVMYRQQKPGAKLHVELIDSNKKNLGDTILIFSNSDNNWHKQSVGFHATSTEPKAKLYLWFEGDGVIDLDFISLFPSDTWRNRPGGLRADMVQMLADMKPGFIRFPGGCIVEGFDLSNRYRWKNTIGVVEDRQLIMNRWNIEFAHRPTPDYFQSFGLGFFEYFQLAEDIGAEPLPILNCGMACQFNSAELVPLDELGPYVQDALDLIEFANGDVATKWGKIRADMGHPAPFHLKMMGVGNENWGPQYLERLAIFTNAIKEKYPDFKLVNSSGTDPNGERFDLLNTTLRRNNADIIDEHYYRRPEWFLQNAKRYDDYPRNGSKVFAGEYAAQSDKTVSINNQNSWITALSEAAFMTGLERNADVVCMASYAPLFSNVDGWQWTPDLIWVNNLKTYGTPDYYVQKMYSLNKGSKVVPITLNNDVIAGQDSLYASAVVDDKTNELIIKLVNVSSQQKTNTISLQGVKSLAGVAKLMVMQSNNLNAVNTFDQETILPKESSFIVKNRAFALIVLPYSFSVLRIKLIPEQMSVKKEKSDKG